MAPNLQMRWRQSIAMTEKGLCQWQIVDAIQILHNSSYCLNRWGICCLLCCIGFFGKLLGFPFGSFKLVCMHNVTTWLYNYHQLMNILYSLGFLQFGNQLQHNYHSSLFCFVLSHSVDCALLHVHAKMVTIDNMIIVSI